MLVFFTRDGEKIGGRRHLVVMHEQKGAAAVFLGLLIKVPAVSTSCNKKFPAPSALLHRQFIWFAQRQSTIEEQNHKGEDLGGDVEEFPRHTPSSPNTFDAAAACSSPRCGICQWIIGDG